MAANDRPDEIQFKFVRSPFFRVVHSNGAWGGITPHQELSITFYSERPSVPRHITHQLTPEGQLGPEISRDIDGNIQRDYEVEILMNMTEAVNLHEWIGDKIDEWRKINPDIPQDQPEL